MKIDNYLREKTKTKENKSKIKRVFDVLCNFSKNMFRQISICIYVILQFWSVQYIVEIISRKCDSWIRSKFIACSTEDDSQYFFRVKTTNDNKYFFLNYLEPHWSLVWQQLHFTWIDVTGVFAWIIFIT